ncbi:MAG: hypothetical protein AUI36_43490 [Cyanobacteria bacterium 13_1_40CM_2_61_4]|nr:MAG: hypothetical protein AUI36_43490 [Cyanobacteria bacterium 13_1_40CM_2_61_4]
MGESQKTLSALVQRFLVRVDSQGSRVTSDGGLILIRGAGIEGGNLWRRLALPRRIGNWSLTSLQQRQGRQAVGW